MRTGSDNHQALLADKAGENTAKIYDIGAYFFYIFADPGTDFDHRLNYFRFHLLAEQRFAVIQNFRDVRAQFAGFGIDYLKLFFDTERELLEHIRRGLHIFASIARAS